MAELTAGAFQASVHLQTEEGDRAEGEEWGEEKVRVALLKRVHQENLH